MPHSRAPFALAAPRIFDGERFLDDHRVLVRDAAISGIVASRDCPADIECIDLETGFLAPGFVDLQVNGGGGRLFHTAPSSETLFTLQSAHAARGTTTLLPTLLSASREHQAAAVAAVAAARGAGAGAIAGLHLEGPFFAPGRRGAHAGDSLRDARADDIDWLCTLRDFPVLLTLAPECVAPAWIARLAQAGLTVCAGHTEATYEQMAAAADSGLCGVTHLFNAMSPLAARQPGAVGAALERDDLWAGIIADGHHVHAASIRLAHAAKPAGKLLLVSDAMATVGSASDSFELYGETIRARDGRLVNASGVLAGSAIGMLDAVRHAHRTVGLPLEDCLRMASLYPAAAVGLDTDRGRLRAGYRADIVHLDDDLSVARTWLAGTPLAPGED